MAPTSDSPAAVSPLLRAAQEQLLALRQAHRARVAHQAAQAGHAPASPEPPSTAVRPPLEHTPSSYIDLGDHKPPTLAAAIAALPPHLGWENPRFAEHLRRIKNNESRIENEDGQVSAVRQTARNESSSAAPIPNPQLLVPDSSAHIRVYPDLALAMLRRKQAAAGRVWLLLRHLDPHGRGWVTVREATAALTADDSPLRICGRRQLGNLLNAGDGLFWDRAARGDLPGLERPVRSDGQLEPRLWLRSVTRVAAALGVGRLAIAPVAVDITALTGTIGHVRAHFYATFHSGRQKTDFVTGRARARAPIARATLAKLADACPNSQRAYEKRAGVHTQTAFAIGPEAPPRNAPTAVAQETAWQRGRAFFRLTDAHGRYGPAGRIYLAWQLPNEYTGPHKRLTRSRMKRMNRALADLLDNGMTGNDERRNGPARPTKRFFGNAKAAWTADRRPTPAPPTDRYWRAPDGGWHVWSSGSAGQWDGKSLGHWTGGAVDSPAPDPQPRTPDPHSPGKNLRP